MITFDRVTTHHPVLYCMTLDHHVFKDLLDSFRCTKSGKFVNLYCRWVDWWWWMFWYENNTTLWFS